MKLLAFMLDYKWFERKQRKQIMNRSWNKVRIWHEEPSNMIKISKFISDCFVARKADTAGPAAEKTKKRQGFH
jgi:hypothetical protein